MTKVWFRQSRPFLVLMLGVSLLAASRAGATIKLGDAMVFGDLSAQNLFRMRQVGNFNLVQQRNTLRLGLEYKWLEDGKLAGKWQTPGFVDKSSVYVLYRGVYDSVYDLQPGGHFYSFTGQRLGQFSDIPDDTRDALKYENNLREAYVDIDFADIPLSLRLGKQQIVWGETDNFRMLDRANSLDLTWHFQQEIPAPPFGWDEIRQTFWMLKFLYDIGDVWRFNQTFLEWYWNPGDWHPAKQAYLPRPWGLPFLDPLDNPVDGTFRSSFCAGSKVRTVRGLDGTLQPACASLMNGTKLFKQGDYSRNPMENSQVGVRLHSIAPFGLEFTLAYFYQRWSGDDGTNYAPLRGLAAQRRP